MNQIWPEPEPEFDRNFVSRRILLTKMTTRLIILDCAGYISTFKAVIFFGSKKPVSRSIKSKKQFLKIQKIIGRGIFGKK